VYTVGDLNVYLDHDDDANGQWLSELVGGGLRFCDPRESTSAVLWTSLRRDAT